MAARTFLHVSEAFSASNHMLAGNVTQFTLAVYCPRAHDATSLYRGMGPLSAMERQDRRLKLLPYTKGPEGLELGWNWLARADALFVQRPWLKEHAQLIVQAKMMGRPVWVDWDDDYASVHPSNTGYAVFHGCDEILEHVVQMADVISVSVQEIADRRARKNKLHGKFRTVPNAAQWPLVPLEKARKRRVTWRGGASHTFDLLQVLSQLHEVSRYPQFSNWEWCFLGDVPWEVEAAIPRENLVADFGADPYLYMEAMSKLLSWVHIVPLADIPFNPAKSNLAWIEATIAGSVVIAPAWPEWRRPGIMNYGRKGDFGQVLVDTMKAFAEHTCHPAVLESRDFIKAELTLEKVNVLRWQIINEILEPLSRLNPQIL